jgi:hypothetical protein
MNMDQQKQNKEMKQQHRQTIKANQKLVIN